MSTRTAKRQGPGSGAAKATANSCREIKVPTNPKLVNAKLGKAQDMGSRSQRTDITPGDLDNRAQGWYAKRATPGGSPFGFMRRLFG